jgi:hypothetical protein
MPAAIAREMPSGSIVMAGGMAVIAVVRPRGCSSRANGSPDTSTDRRTNGSTTSAAGDRADRSPCAGAE